MRQFPALTGGPACSAARLALCVLFLFAGAVRPALAQEEELDLNARINSMEFPVEPPLVKAAEVRDIIKALSLDAATGDLVRSLHEGYVAVFTAAATERRDRVQALMKEVQESGDWVTVGMEMQEIEKAWITRRNDLGVEFFENVKATLTPDQLAKWPAYERDRRRRTQLHIGAFFAGEGVDVVELVDDLKLEEPQRAAAAPLLESYAVELDGLLQQRLRAAEEVRNIDYMDPAAQAGMFDKYERILTVRRQIRDANRKHAQVVAGSIPGPASERLTREFHARSYPRIYAPTEADSFITTVLALDLTPDQRSAIEGVAAIYRDQAAAVNQQLAQLMARQEESVEASLKERNFMVLAMVGAMSAFADEGTQAQQAPFDAKDLLMDDEQDKRLEELHRQRRGFVVAAIDQVWSVLTPAQQEKAPRPEVPEESSDRLAVKQVRNMMRQSMQMAEEAVREAQQEIENNPSR